MTTDLQDGWIVNLGQAKYLEVLELQRLLVELRQQNLIPDTLLLVEHEPVITLGRRGNRTNILSTVEELASQGIQIHQAERGGDVTYHGPGQLVGYPIIHLARRRLGVRTFVHLLEDIIIRTLADFNIRAGRHPEHRGVWTGGLKVAALGVAVKRWVTLHGFALNVSPDLDHFCYINPCDLGSGRVTSMTALLGKPPGMTAVREVVGRRFAELFPANWLSISPIELGRKVKMQEEIHQAEGKGTASDCSLKRLLG